MGETNHRKIVAPSETPLPGSLPETPSGSGIEELLQQRQEIDALLQEKFRRDVTILFTDIQGSTAYFSQRGDVDGRLMIKRHNDLLFPIITAHEGTVVKIIGDAIMASFQEPLSAVRAAVAMQRALRDANRQQEAAKQIHIRVGINSGYGLVETHDVFGDVVNVAARVVSRTLHDQILIAKATYDRLPDTIPCQPLGAATVKGKETPLDVFEVLWNDYEPLPSTRRGPGVTRQPAHVVVLEVSCQAERLKMSCYERLPGAEPAVKTYEFMTVSFAAVQQAVDAMMALLNRATSPRGMLDAAAWQELRAIGHGLYAQLLPPAVRDTLRTTTAANLLLALDDTLVHIPWELLFDGQTFLGLHFNMGRSVSVPQTVSRERRHVEQQALTMLIVADPRGDLAAAAHEGRTIRDELLAEGEAAAHRLRVEIRSTHVSTATIKALLPQYDILHYAGHADYDLQEPAQSGWLLADGKLPAAEIPRSDDVSRVPQLVFCNACRSGQTAAWQIPPAAAQKIYGLAHAFLLAGAQHYIGTFWEVPDHPSSTFAIHFYRALAHGMGVGEALGTARHALVEHYGSDSVVWASYVLYGDPTYRYLEPLPSAPAVVEEVTVIPALPQRQDRPWQGWLSNLSRTKPLAVGLGVLLLLCLGGLAVQLLRPRTPLEASPLRLAYQTLEQGDWQKAETLFQQLTASAEQRAKSQAYAGLGAVALSRGNSQQALELVQQAETLAPDVASTHLVRGHIFLQQGKTAEATAAYRLAIQKPVAFPWQLAMAYDRLGRIYAAQGETSKALEQYDKAISQQGDMAVVYANKGYLLERLGQSQEALTLYQQALHLMPNDPLTTTLLRDVERRQQLAQDQEQQQQIDRLVDELVQAYKDGQGSTPPEDSWSSPPLTLAFLDFRRRDALSARAGEAEFVMLSVTHTLRTSGRVVIVEREVLQKVLAELKLSVSDIVDSQTALRPGRILAARLLAIGNFTPTGKMGLFSMRLVETETSLVNVDVVDMVEPPVELGALVERATRKLLQEIRRAYPLRGRIERLTSQGHIVLNIGARQGMTPGLILQVFESDGPLTANDTAIHIPVGRIEVTHVEPQRAVCRVLEQSGVMQPGSKVQEVVAP